MEAASASANVNGSRKQYGKACTNCSRVKCRCIYLPDQGICERCQRLKKDCQSSTPLRKRSNRPPTVSRTARLEEKLDGLVSMLHSQATVSQLEPGISDTPWIISPPSTEPGVPTLNFDVGISSSSISNKISIYLILDNIAEEQLNKFRHSFLPLFPFVYIPTTMSANELRLQKPFLWLVIMSFTTKLAAQQISMGHTIRQIISTNLVAEHEKSMDILLGLICYLGWFHFHKKRKPYHIMWTQLAVALVFELGIHKSGSRNGGQISSKADWNPPQTLRGPIRNMEDRRTLLGVFIVSSITWTSLRQMEPLRWTPYMDDCVRTLRSEKETELDLLLAFQVKCYVLADQITLPQAEWGAADEGTRRPATYFLKALHLQLQDIRQTLPPEMESNKLALLSLCGTEVIGQESLLRKPKGQEQTDLQRLDGLESLLTTIERWFRTFSQVPLDDFIGIPYNIYTQHSHCIMILFKLTTLDEPGWDKEEVRKRVDLLDILEGLTQKLESLPQAMGLEGAMELVDAVRTEESGIFFRAAPPLIRSMRAKFAAELAPPSLPTDDISSILEVPDEIDMSFANDPWLTEMFENLHEFDLLQWS